MSNQLSTIFRFNLGYAKRLMEDVADDQMAHQPAAGVNPPGWIIGHLALVNDLGVSLLGGSGGMVPEAWQAEFGAGSTPEPSAGGYPSKAELMSKLQETSDALLAAVEGADIASLTDPNPFAPLREALPTTGDLLAHVLSSHIGTHVGQLSTWRRQMGFPPLL